MLSFSTASDGTSWGRLRRPRQAAARPRFRDEVINWGRATDLPRLAVGMRRSYGDVCTFDSGHVVEMAGLDRIIAFDPATGLLRAEAGMTLAEIARFAVPRGFFLPTTPGTWFVSLGGAIANDVHGKNHHRAGTFGCHVPAIGLLRSAEGVLELKPGDPLFAATIGGLGLTGIILWAEIQLVRIPSAALDSQTIPFDTLEDFIALAEESADTHEFTVAWLDCFSPVHATSGLFFRSNWARRGPRDLPKAGALSVPVVTPSFLLSPLTMMGFNAAYQTAHRTRSAYATVPLTKFFYPLDSIGNWNRLYGKKGFYQYQCVLPYETARLALIELLIEIKRIRDGSFLCVLKTFGDKPSPGLLSFPRPGITLALDFPNRGERTTAAFKRFDAIVAAAGGRLYAAKDARIPPALFKAGYPEWEKFAGLIDRTASSDFARRMFA